MIRLLACALAVASALSAQIPDLSGQVSVTQFGADPRGSIDSSLAFRRAIEALEKTGGGRVFVPCGTYLLMSSRGSAAITIAIPTISLIGANQSCVTLNYRGSGTAIAFQMVPFTIRPAGVVSGFTLHGVKGAQVGIQTGTIVGATFENLVVEGFTDGDGFRLEDSVSAFPPNGSWTERTVWIGVSEKDNKVGWHLVTTGHPINNSFGYNDFLNIAMNVGKGETGFWLDRDGFLYSGTVRAMCNSEGRATPTEEGPICIRSSGNWADEFVWVTGEYASAVPGQTPPTSLLIDNNAAFTGFGQVLVSGMSVVNRNPAKFDQNAHLSFKPQSWDTGTVQLNGTNASPLVAFGARSGTVGVKMGNNIESPFVTMYDYPGNEFSIAAVRYGTPIESMTHVWDVDNGGNVKLAGNEHSKGVMEADKGFLIPPSAKRPECGALTRGTIWVTQSESPAGDTLQVCQKVAATFKWVAH